MSNSQDGLPTAPSAEQAKTTALLRQLLGSGIANRYLDFCRLAGGDLPLHATRTLAAHSLRELDGLLRQVLATPLDAVIRDDPDQKALRKKASKALKQLGFDDGARQRADGALQPQLNFKKQVERILVRLRLDPEGQIGTQWLSFRDALSQVHQRTFDKSLKIDDEFRRTLVKPFSDVIHALAKALQEQYAALLRRAAEIAALEPSSGVDAFVKEIPGAAQLQMHFYDRLASEDWLLLLEQRGLLNEPLFAREEDDTGFRQWPVGRYLLKMAASSNASTRAIVMSAIRSVASSRHPDVHHDGMEIVAALPANEAATLADVIAGWLSPEFVLVMQFPPVIIRNLIRGGEVEAALSVAAAYFQVFGAEGRLRTLHDQFMYEHYLPEVANDLAETAPLPAIAMYCGLLKQIVVIRGRQIDGRHGDDSHYVVGDFDDNPSHHDVPASLAAAIIHSAEVALKKDGSSAPTLIEEVRSHGGKLFERLAMKIVAMSSAVVPELAAAYLCDETLIDQDWCRKEYAAIANVWFGALEPNRRKAIIDFIRAIPIDHEERFKQWFLRVHSNMPTDDDARAYRFTTVRDIVWGWRNALPEEFRREIERGIAEFGGPDDWRNTRHREATSPLSGAEMRSQPIEATIELLRRWRASEDGEDRARKTRAMGNELRTAAAEESVAFSAKASEFENLHPILLRRYLEAMEQAASNGVPIRWSELLGLLSRLGRSPIDPSYEDGYWTLKCMIDLVSAGLRGRSEGIPLQDDPDLRALALSFHALSLKAIEPGEPPDFRKPDLFNRARQTARGAAVELCLLVLRRLGRHPVSPAAGGAIIDRAHDLRSILESELGDRSSASDAAHAIMGRYLNLLFELGPDWLKAHLPLLLPADNPHESLVWRAHLESDKGPLDGLMDEMAFCYADAIEHISKTDPSDRDADRLTDYLLTLQLRGALPPVLLLRFLQSAPVGLRRHGMRLVGQTIGKSPDPFATRAKSYWATRLHAAASASDKEPFRLEIGAIGTWFLWIDDADWMIQQLLAVLDAGYAPNDVYTVIRHLAKLDEEKIQSVVKVLYALATSNLTTRFTLTSQPIEMRRMLAAGKRSGHALTMDKVVRIANVLASKGDPAYLDLLDDP